MSLGFEDISKEFAYSAKESQYVNNLKKQEKYANKDRLKDYNSFFPNGWAISQSYELKAQFLDKAISNNVSLFEVEGINVFEEGVITK